MKHFPEQKEMARDDWVDGNHENFDRLNQLPVHQRHGGKVHYIHPHIVHLMRGHLYDIDGYTLRVSTQTRKSIF